MIASTSETFVSDTRAISMTMSGELEQLGERIAEHAAHLDAATHRLLADLRAGSPTSP
jgi:hypothetical protein